MKKTAILFLSFAALTSSGLLAQKRTPAQATKPSIEIEGVNLHLGMMKADVAELFVGKPMEKMDEQTWTVGKTGTVQFKNGNLIFAARSWMNDGADQIDAIFKAVSSLNREGFTACRVLSDTAPHTERIGIDCGQKSVLIIETVSGSQRVTEVSERIGNFDFDSK